jgi:diacylglycerol kinase family enzyme
MPVADTTRITNLMLVKPTRVCVLLNTAASGFQDRPVRDICDAISSVFASHRVAADIHLVFGGLMEKRAKQEIATAGIDALVAGGGDGTAGAVAGALAGTNIPLGILPLGRANHFARDLGIPARLEQAVEVIATGHTALVDTAEVNGRAFVNNSSLGAYPFLVLDRERRRRRRGVLRPIAALLAGLKLLRMFPLRRVSVRVENWSEVCRTPCLFVGNNRYQLELFALGTRPALTGGELWIYIAPQQTRLSLVWFTFKSLMGMTDPDRDLRLLHGTSAEIRAEGRRLDVALDGEVLRMRAPLRYRIRPASLRVYVNYRAGGEPS